MTDRPGFRQIVDWRAAFIAANVAGLVFFVLQMALTGLLLGSPWILPRMTAALVMGRNVLPPPATLDLSIVVVGFLIHQVLAEAFGLLIASVVHRGGLLLGILVGAALGLAVYVINYWMIAQWFPWFLDLRGGLLLGLHVAFGAVAGGLYELLEVERFEPVAGASASVEAR